MNWPLGQEYVRQLNGLPAPPFKFSICTLVTRPHEYVEMVDSFVKAGFDPKSCEYLYIANIGVNHYDAYSGYNLFLQAAGGEYIILCHQDILLKFDRREVLEQRIHELDALDSTWAVLGNAGGAVIRISDSSVEYNTGPFPAKVDSLDGNFILGKREANLCLSHDMAGFHFYDTDLCRIAKVLGRTSWVVDFHLYHKGRGNIDDHFFLVRDRLISKYRSALRGGMIQGTCAKIYLSGNAFATWLFNPSRRETLFCRIYGSRKETRHGKQPDAAAKARELYNNLGAGWYAFFWMRRKIKRPFQNLQHWLGKKLFSRPPARYGLTKSNP